MAVCWPDFRRGGSLYGTASGGGAGEGVVFQLKTNANGQWQEKVLHTFCPRSGCLDGSTPYAGLVFDIAGNLYGTTSAGGAHNFGTVFRLALGTNGKWKEKILHSFNNDGKDGYLPEAGLILDGAGDLFGTTYSGGGDRPRGCRINGCGTVFELMQDTKGKWTEKILTTWGNNRRDGKTPANPGAALVFDAKGNLYGSTINGGAHHIGTVFRLTTAKNRNWKQTVLHSFEFDGQDADAMYPDTTLLLDSAGHLYGTSPLGGTYGCNGNGCGTVFEITP